MNPSQFFLSPVNLGSFAILILLDVVMLVGCVGGLAGVFFGTLLGVMTTVLPHSLGLARIVPIHPIVVSTSCSISLA